MDTFWNHTFTIFSCPNAFIVIDMSLICHCLYTYMSVTNTKAYATLVTEHIFILTIFYISSLVLINNIISANTVKVINRFCK